MKTNLKRGIALLLTATLAALSVSSCKLPEGKPESERFDEFLHEAFVETLSSSVLDTHYTLRDPAAYGITDVPRTFSHFDTSTLEEDEKELAETQKELAAFRYNELTKEQQLTHDVLTDFVAIQRKFDGLTYYQEPNTSTGIQSSLPVLLAEYAFSKSADVDDYLGLLDDVDDYFDSMLEFQKERSKQGLFMTDTLADEVIKGLEDFARDPEENFLLSTFDTRVSNLSELTEAQRTEYSARNREAVLNTVIPAFQDYAAELRSLKGTGKGDGSLARLPKGKEYYEALVAYSTGSSKSVKELDKWIDALAEGLYDDVVTVLTKYPQDAALGIEALLMEDLALDDPAAILEDLQEKIMADFVPLSGVTHQLKIVDPSLQESMSPAFYLTPPIDAPAENPIYTNPYYIDDSTNLYLYTTLAHEGYPGHLYENNFFVQQKPNPLRCTLSFPGYSEGWGTYAEMWAYTQAPMEHPAAAELQRINQELILLLYCKADIGVHFLGWDENALSDYAEEQGFSREAGPALFQAVTGDPANYLSYGIGYFEFMALRERAEEKLGAAFSSRAFHSMLLSAGPATFGVLATQTDRFIEEAKGSAASAPSTAAA